MRLGLIARADNSGLGIQTWEFARHMHPDRVLVIDVGHLYDGGHEHANKRTYLDRYPEALISSGWTPDPRLLAQFVNGLDVVFTAETTYSADLVSIAHRAGARVVVQYNYEFLAHQLYTWPQPDVFAAPSPWMWDATNVPNRVLLPVPIATDRFPARIAPATARNFLHVVGRPAAHDRNGTPDLLTALQYVTAPMRLTLTCQDVDYLAHLIHAHQIPDHIEIATESVDVNDYWDLYNGHDVLILPRRFGGLCLPAQEAIGAAMPVIMPDIDPNNSWLPQQWLVPATVSTQFPSTTTINVYRAEPVALAALMDRFATDAEFYTDATAAALGLRDRLSWDTLAPDYRAMLENVCH